MTPPKKRCGHFHCRKFCQFKSNDSWHFYHKSPHMYLYATKMVSMESREDVLAICIHWYSILLYFWSEKGCWNLKCVKFEEKRQMAKVKVATFDLPSSVVNHFFKLSWGHCDGYKWKELASSNPTRGHTPSELKNLSSYCIFEVEKTAIY